VTIRGDQEYAVWDVVLGCGHFTQEHTPPKWNPEDGPIHRKNRKRRPLEEVLEVLAKAIPTQRRTGSGCTPTPPRPRTFHAMPYLREHPHHHRLPARRLAHGSDDSAEAQANLTTNTGAAITEAGIRSRAIAETARHPARRRVTPDLD
jgi:hypothetical protein